MAQEVALVCPVPPVVMACHETSIYIKLVVCVSHFFQLGTELSISALGLDRDPIRSQLSPDSVLNSVSQPWD